MGGIDFAHYDPVVIDFEEGEVISKSKFFENEFDFRYRRVSGHINKINI